MKTNTQFRTTALEIRPAARPPQIRNVEVDTGPKDVFIPSLNDYPAPMPTHPWYPDGVTAPKEGPIWTPPRLQDTPAPKPTHPWYPNGVRTESNEPTWALFGQQNMPEPIDFTPNPELFWNPR